MGERKSDNIDNDRAKELILKDFISNLFTKTETNFQQDVYVGGTVPDFFVKFPSGSTATFEIKKWKPSKETRERASFFTRMYEDASGVDHSFIVLEGLSDSDPVNGLVAPADIEKVLQSEIIKEKTIPVGKAPIVGELPQKKIFAAMPIQDKYDDTYTFAMQYAALKNDAHCIRVDHEKYTGNIVSMIKQLIQDCVAVIADVSESRPNVLYEMGFAEGLKKPIVQISCMTKDELPFDVSQNNTIFYKRGQVSKLRPKLTAFLSAIISETN